jgi:hypothetical protein
MQTHRNPVAGARPERRALFLARVNNAQTLSSEEQHAHDKVERWIAAAKESVRLGDPAHPLTTFRNAFPNPQPQDLRQTRAARVNHAVELARKASAKAVTTTSRGQFFIPELEFHISTSTSSTSSQAAGPLSPTSPTSVTMVLDAFAALVSPQSEEKTRYLVTM